MYDPAVAGELEGAGRRLGADVPQLLAHARDDRTVALSSQARWAEVLPHAEVRTVETGGHQFLLRDRFEPLAGWLRGLPPR
jgi:pimeloyl-ACP methyl ester carboxylesterase